MDIADVSFSIRAIPSIYSNSEIIFLSYNNYHLWVFLVVIISPVCSVVASSADMMFSVQEDKRAGQVCKTKNKKQLKEVEDAQLAAHR